MQNNHNFWSTQPVGNGKTNEAIKIPKNVSTKVTPLPPTFYFKNLTLNNINIIHDLLSENYVQDNSGKYRLLYSIDFLKWQFSGFSIMLGVFQNDELVGFSLGKKHKIVVNGVCEDSLSVNFLCLKINLRKKNLAPLIIQEMTRQANLVGIFRAVFTAGLVLPFKVASARYFHRVINEEKMHRLYDEKHEKIDLDNFDPEKNENNNIKKKESRSKNSNITEEIKINTNCRSNDKIKEKSIGKNSDLQDIKKEFETYFYHDIDTNTIYKSVENSEFKKIYEIYEKESTEYGLYEKTCLERFEEITKPIENVLYTLVSTKNGIIKGFISFFIIDTLIVTKNTKIKGAYLYHLYGENKAELVHHAIKYAETINADIFNCISIGKYFEFIGKLSFKPGDGVLNYYLFNWDVLPIPSSYISFTLP
ncbi:hypothetical protein EDEG_02435 [Edhazardia aedis USNM 41457]|uniref:Glycylpeptide N-tetradecanoyltransferase n=1 Tax=Edhazardia aedis (strain USNM 41457) TaxID=1003232 RepID=J9DPB5_EDHAE|nr:hypothetical protein EDEG_02435 [Edhazardia aedis USNM 41457]|eukprot:EJW03182.1 hypothetical protein EDEG_02435 [Edhazardia aedis USNM 41457]